MGLVGRVVGWGGGQKLHTQRRVRVIMDAGQGPTVSPYQVNGTALFQTIASGPRGVSALATSQINQVDDGNLAQAQAQQT
jgi:hypothetical protein